MDDYAAPGRPRPSSASLHPTNADDMHEQLMRHCERGRSHRLLQHSMRPSSSRPRLTADGRRKTGLAEALLTSVETGYSQVLWQNATGRLVTLGRFINTSQV